MTPTSLVLVALGGALGSVLRYSLSVTLTGRYALASFPMATLLVNLIGSLLIGILFAFLLRENTVVHSQLKIFLGAGLLGGFTTFSTFSVESLALFQRGEITLLITYCVLSVFGGLALCFLGYRIASGW